MIGKKEENDEEDEEEKKEDEEEKTEDKKEGEEEEDLQTSTWLEDLKEIQTKAIIIIPIDFVRTESAMWFLFTI